ncbi:tyrosine-type recombinase/integrase [Glaciibacter psychrotolerans]|uniref:Integrase n=1 Tax=Glaciibacter psychrotolerans TaxID=670054 RepID=A0A7Z0EDQ7_9MICO|nr:tyrosine-type recombinase/integrase [Leifsonia psychrotolerans]NYJ19618.1 integrase [Leifsonia psychrotolerans]
MELIEKPQPGGTELTQRHIKLVENALLASRAPATRRAYAGAIKRFTEWSAANGNHTPLPADPRSVAAWLVTLAADDGLSMSTITIACSALKAWHLDGGHRDVTRHRGIVQTLAGLRRELGTAPRKKARAFDVPELRRLLNALDTDSNSGRRDRALMLLSFASGMRRSEVVALKRSDLQLSASGIRITIRRSKTDQVGAGVEIAVVAGSNPATCPVRSMRTWLGVRGGGPEDAVFTRVTRGDVILKTTQLSGQSVSLILKATAAKAGVEVEHLSGHSYRASHITEAAAAGVPLERIARTTRHSSSVILGYIRSANLMEETSAASLGL